MNIGLKSRFTEDQDVRAGIQYLLALPFLPVEDIESVFDFVVENISEEVVALAEYVEVTYVRGRSARGRRRAVPARLRACGTSMN